MAASDPKDHSILSREQKLLFVFTFNLVRAADHLQSTRLLRFLEQEGVLKKDAKGPGDQVVAVKAEGTPAARTIVLLEIVHKNCGSDAAIFRKFVKTLKEKQPSVLKDHMPDESMTDDSLNRLYGQVKAYGNGFRPEKYKAFFGAYNPYVTSRESPDSLKRPDQPLRVEPQIEPSVPKIGLNVLWITEMTDQHAAVLHVIEKQCANYNCDSLQRGPGFSYYSCRGEDGGLINFFIVPGSESHGDLVSAALLYSDSMGYRAWADDLDVILLTGHCWAAENRKGPKVGDICVISGAHKTRVGEQDVKKPAARPFAVVHHVCKQMQAAKSARWQKPEAIMKRPNISYRWQALWITRLHCEISKTKEGKKPCRWFTETGFDSQYTIFDEENVDVLSKYLPNWEDDELTVMAYCSDSGLWPDASEPNEELLKQVERGVRTVKDYPSGDVEPMPRVHVEPVLSGIGSPDEVTQGQLGKNCNLVDWSSLTFYQHASTRPSDKTIVSIKAVVGYIGWHEEPKFASYGNELLAIFTLDLIRGLHQNPRFK